MLHEFCFEFRCTRDPKLSAGSGNGSIFIECVSSPGRKNSTTKSSVAEPEPQGAATFAGAGAVTLIQFLAPAPAPCYKLGILKSFLVTDSASCIFVHGHPFLTVY